MRAINTFEGVVDKDSLPTIVKNNNLVDALNSFSGKGGQTGARQNIPGNVKIDYPLSGALIHTVIGCVEDTVGNTLIYFVKNNLDVSPVILRYYPVEERISVVMQGSFIGLDNRIHSARVIDGDLLVWCDGFGINSVENSYQVVGSEPKILSLKKANTYGKRLTYEFYYDSLSFQTLDQTYSIAVTDLDGTPIFAETVFYTVNPVIDADLAFAAFATALDGIGAPIDVSLVGNIITASPTFSDRRIVFTQSTFDVHCVSINHYPVNTDTRMITLKKFMPVAAPLPRQVADSTLNENKIWGHTFQFRYRDIYFNGSRSEFSPVSYVPTNFVRNTDYTGDVYYNSQDFNKIIININDTRFLAAEWKSLVRKIEIAVRDGENGLWKSVGVYNVADIGVNVNEIEFLNDTILPVIPSDTNSAPDTQALKNFDYVPRLAETLVPVYGKEGECRLAICGVVDDYDLEPGLYADIGVYGYNIGDVEDTSDQFSYRKTFKSGGVYDVSVVYEDLYGRQSPALKLGRVRMPFDVASDAYGFTVDFNSPPPIWANRFRILASKNLNQAKYLQVPCSSVTYWQIYPAEKIFQIVPIVPGTTATHVAFFISLRYAIGGTFEYSAPQPITDFDNPPTVTQSFGVYLFDEVSVEANVFIPLKNDRLQILNWHNYPITDPIEDMNVKIAGYSLVPSASLGVANDLGAGFYVFVEIDENLISKFPDSLLLGPQEWDEPDRPVIQCEIYRERTSEDPFSYEMDSLYYVTNPGLSTRSHGGQKIIRDRGDTYITDKELQVHSLGLDQFLRLTKVDMVRVEHPNLHYAVDTPGGDFGRANAENEFYREVYAFNKIRLSDVYVPDVAVNGISSFRGGEFININKDLGYIKRAETLGGVMLVVCQFGSQPIYVGTDSISFGGNSLVGVSNKILNKGADLTVNYGSFHPESIINNGRYIYGFDVKEGVVWRYNPGNGMYPVSDYGWHNEFKDLVKDNWVGFDRGSFGAEGGFDPVRNTYFLYTTDPLRVKRVVGFNEDKNGFDGDYSFMPECFGCIGINMVSFKDGQLWIHANSQAENQVPCNFYGDQYDCTVTFALNVEPGTVKIPKNMRIRADKAWSSPLIEVLPNASFEEGMKSRLKPNKFKLYEGQWCADFLRDMNDTKAEFLAIGDTAIREATALLQGRLIRGEAILITLQLDDPSILSNLESVDINYINSFNSF